MQDLTKYGNQELSLIVMNDEYLYTQRYRLTQDFLKEMGLKFTDEQWAEFKDDLENEDD